MNSEEWVGGDDCLALICVSVIVIYIEILFAQSSGTYTWPSFAQVMPLDMDGKIKERDKDKSFTTWQILTLNATVILSPGSK
jgi:hypothetical protein